MRRWGAARDAQVTLVGLKSRTDAGIAELREELRARDALHGRPVTTEALTSTGTLSEAAGHLLEARFEYCNRSGAYVETVERLLEP